MLCNYCPVVLPCYCSATIYANRHYLNIYHRTHAQRLAVNAPEKPKIIGDVFIHPQAVVHPTATVSDAGTVVICACDRSCNNVLFLLPTPKTRKKSNLAN